MLFFVLNVNSVKSLSENAAVEQLCRKVAEKKRIFCLLNQGGVA
jgi:hypothetical protein